MYTPSVLHCVLLSTLSTRSEWMQYKHSYLLVMLLLRYKLLQKELRNTSERTTFNPALFFQFNFMSSPSPLFMQ